MNNTTHGKRAGPLAWALIATLAIGHPHAYGAGEEVRSTQSSALALSMKQQSIPPIAAAMALGDMSQLNVALNRGLGALAAMPGVESQLQSHIAVSLNVGLTAPQLRQVSDMLAEAGQADAARRTRAAVDKHLAGTPR